MNTHSTDNRTLRTHESKHQYVLLAERNGIYKYVGKTYWSCHDLNLTVKITTAKKWNSIKSVENFVEKYCSGYKTKIKEIKVTYDLVESEDQ
ncbi:hypothetical protein C8E03_108114 [Lachnotalea glycerini]|uniref:Uncharacterized protein n=1 Tax=Lachnotalea glycerini TaxID=1763509 RepID=A0A318EK15_9FIRM|nr:hypothetical protein [Lachnotalea glycerini]PXV88387.1 hypothetical protein C8E03_108114 [Lachnotalea glycerini]